MQMYTFSPGQCRPQLMQFRQLSSSLQQKRSDCLLSRCQLQQNTQLRIPQCWKCDEVNTGPLTVESLLLQLYQHLQTELPLI